MSALLDLAARVEAATGADRELDLLVKAAVYGGFAMVSPFNGEWCLYREQPDDPRKGKSFERPRNVTHAAWIADTYTASLDAAMSLVPEGRKWLVAGRLAACDPCEDSVHAATPALALCAAALRARAAMEASS